MTAAPTAPRLRIRLVFADGSMIGPGKADLLFHIQQTGSIAAAGRRMDMSYKRAWQLVETMNTMFSAPLVVRSRGGSSHGGAQLTETGVRVLALFRQLEERAAGAASAEIAAISGLHVPVLGGSADDPDMVE